MVVPCEYGKVTAFYYIELYIIFYYIYNIYTIYIIIIYYIEWWILGYANDNTIKYHRRREDQEVT